MCVVTSWTRASSSRLRLLNLAGGPVHRGLQTGQPVATLAVAFVELLADVGQLALGAVQFLLVAGELLRPRLQFSLLMGQFLTAAVEGLLPLRQLDTGRRDLLPLRLRLRTDGVRFRLLAFLFDLLAPARPQGTVRLQLLGLLVELFLPGVELLRALVHLLFPAMLLLGSNLGQGYSLDLHRDFDGAEGHAVAIQERRCEMGLPLTKTGWNGASLRMVTPPG